jgi:Tat protein secretion system quality control protein TatD with DNase activity
VETLKVLASVKGLPIEQVAAITVENSLRLFSGIK